MARARSKSSVRLLSFPLGMLSVGLLFFFGLDSATFGVVTLCVVLSEILGRSVAVPVFSKHSLESDPSDIWQNAMGHVFLRWIIVTFAIGMTVTISPSNLFGHDPAMAFVLAGAVLANGILYTIAAFRNQRSFAGSVCHWLVTLIVLAGGVFIGIHNAVVIFCLYLLMQCAVAGLCIANMPSLFDTGRTLGVYPKLDVGVALRNIDLLLVPLLLDAVTCATYLFARSICLIGAVGLRFLDNATLENIGRIYLMRNASEFCGSAARLNLGYLLIGGSGSLIAIGLSQTVSGNLVITQNGFDAVFFWLLLAQGGPMLFGATVGLMRVTGTSGTVVFLQFIAALSVCGSFYLGAIDSAADLAKYFALAQLAISMVAALILGLQHGVWPGVTAIMHKQIRLI